MLEIGPIFQGCGKSSEVEQFVSLQVWRRMSLSTVTVEYPDLHQVLINDPRGNIPKGHRERERPTANRIFGMCLPSATRSCLITSKIRFSSHEVASLFVQLVRYLFGLKYKGL